MARTYSRRAVLAGTAGAVLGAAAPAASDEARAQTDPYAAKPDHVTLTGYDDAPGVLERYRPRLVTRDLDATPTLYAWTATSSEYDTTMCCYWAWYATQQGLSTLDSHLGDREPVYVEVAADGSVSAVYYDAWHYLRNASSVTVPQDGTRPLLYVQSPHHFYSSTTELGRDVALADMTDIYPSWHRNGWNVSRPAVLEPWLMRSRESWWPADSTLGLGFSLGQFRSEAALLAGSLLGGAAAQTDEVA